jgi:hypothetical protein
MARAIRTSGRRVEIEADDAQLSTLLDDAQYYADEVTGPDEAPKALVLSARATVAAIARHRRLQPQTAGA